MLTNNNGTNGCIGIQEGADKLNSFYNKMRSILEENDSVDLSVDIDD